MPVVAATMASYVYFKFKSQKEPQRVSIDGPHTDVWNLKREIISISRLGDGTDFDLKIYKENSDEGLLIRSHVHSTVLTFAQNTLMTPRSFRKTPLSSLAAYRHPHLAKAALLDMSQASHLSVRSPHMQHRLANRTRWS